MTQSAAGGSGIELNAARKQYGAVRALDDVTFTADQRMTGLLGPNGAGKTTLLRMVATVLAPDAGSIRVLGLDPGDSRQRVEIRRRLGYLPQDPGFYRNFTVSEFADYVAILKEITARDRRRAEVDRVLAAVDLTSQARSRIKTLSGGMRRRLALALALLGDPDVLLLDEPTAGLDPEQRLRFREMISQLAHRPILVLSTHQTEDVMALCERVLVLVGGRVRFDGTPAAMAALATGRVWIDDVQDPRATLSWRNGDGRYRHIGEPPAGATTTAPTVDDAYLLMVRTAGS